MCAIHRRSGTRGKIARQDETTVVRRAKVKQRRGAAAVFGLFLILALIVLMGVTLDFGNIRVAQNELRCAADAAAMAACWEMHEVDSQQPSSSYWSLHMGAWQGANEISAHNVVGQAHRN